jgi:hypothetical protein
MFSAEVFSASTWMQQCWQTKVHDTPTPLAVWNVSLYAHNGNESSFVQAGDAQSSGAGVHKHRLLQAADVQTSAALHYANTGDLATCCSMSCFD